MTYTVQMTQEDVQKKLTEKLTTIALAKTTWRYLYQHTTRSGDIANIAIDVEQRYTGGSTPLYSCIVYSIINNVLFTATDLPNAEDAINQINWDQLEGKLEAEQQLGIEI